MEWNQDLPSFIFLLLISLVSSGEMEPRPPLLALDLPGFPDLHALDPLAPADLDHHALDLLSLPQAWVWSEHASCPSTDAGISPPATVSNMSCDTEHALLRDDQKLTATPQGSYNEIKLVINMIIVQRLRNHTSP